MGERGRVGGEDSAIDAFAQMFEEAGEEVVRDGSDGRRREYVDLNRCRRLVNHICAVSVGQTDSPINQDIPPYITSERSSWNVRYIGVICADMLQYLVRLRTARTGVPSPRQTTHDDFSRLRFVRYVS